jgi:hypothetical protein
MDYQDFLVTDNGISVTGSVATALFEIAKLDKNDLKGVFGWISKKTTTHAFNRLSELGLAEGHIRKGETKWYLTKLGKETVKWINSKIEEKTAEITAVKASFSDKTFQEKLDGNYYCIDDKTSSEFKEDLFKGFGVNDNPLREKAFLIAWDNGHSSGYSEVKNCFYDLADLILEADRLIKEAGKVKK